MFNVLLTQDLIQFLNVFKFCRVADQGHYVTGVDGSDKAAKEFFQDNNIEYKMDAINMAPRGALVFSVRLFLNPSNHSRLLELVRSLWLLWYCKSHPSRIYNFQKLCDMIASSMLG